MNTTQEALREELAEERAESWALWEFVRRYDEWAESDEQCGGPRFDAMLEMRGNLAQPKPHSHNGWRPIKTAPRDGSRVILYRAGSWKDHQCIGWWNHFMKGWRPVNGGFFEGATHWMPLPEPPGEPIPGPDRI